MTYHCFRRSSWKANPSWPDGLEPAPKPPGRAQATFDNIEDARQWCAERNAKLPKDRRARLLGGVYEFTSEI